MTKTLFMSIWEPDFIFCAQERLNFFNTEIARKIRLNEEKDYMSTGNPSLVTHSAGLLATLPVLKHSKVVRILVWFTICLKESFKASKQ